MTYLLLLAVGDVHGHWSDVVGAIAAASDVTGRVPDLCLQVGDAEPFRNEEELAGAKIPRKYRKLGDFSAIQPGDLTCPVFFIGGNHEPYPAFDACTGPFPCEWGEETNAFYLGRAGIAEIKGGLRLAWLSGIYSPHALSENRERSIKDRTYFVETEVREIARSVHRRGRVDVLMTHDWPARIGTNAQGVPAGNEPTRRIVEKLEPLLSLHGHMHLPMESRIGVTTVHCLNAVPSALKGKTGPRSGWWRLYRVVPGHSVSCIAVAGEGIDSSSSPQSQR